MYSVSTNFRLPLTDGESRGGVFITSSGTLSKGGGQVRREGENMAQTQTYSKHRQSLNIFKKNLIILNN